MHQNPSRHLLVFSYFSGGGSKNQRRSAASLVKRDFTLLANLTHSKLNYSERLVPSDILLHRISNEPLKSIDIHVYNASQLQLLPFKQKQRKSSTYTKISVGKQQSFYRREMCVRLTTTVGTHGYFLKE